MSTWAEKHRTNAGPMVAATQERAAQGRQRAKRAIRDLSARGERITFAAVAKEAGVSRTMLYTNEDLRVLIVGGKRKAAESGRRLGRPENGTIMGDLATALSVFGRQQRPLKMARMVISYCRKYPACRTAHDLLASYHRTLQRLGRAEAHDDPRWIAAFEVCLHTDGHWITIVDKQDTELVMQLLKEKV